MSDLKDIKVVEDWETFTKMFDRNFWACLHGVPFRWQNNQKVWMHLLVLITSPEERDVARYFAWVRVSSIVGYLPYVQRIALFSYLRHRHAELGRKFDIPQGYMRYACLVAADHKTTKEADLEELKEEETSSFSTGYFYSKGFHH